MLSIFLVRNTIQLVTSLLGKSLVRRLGVLFIRNVLAFIFKLSNLTLGRLAVLLVGNSFAIFRFSDLTLGRFSFLAFRII